MQNSKVLFLKEFNENKQPVDLVSKELQENFPFKLELAGNSDNKIWEVIEEKMAFLLKQKP